MYRYFFGINDFPFGTCPDPRFLYKMPHVQEALACLQYGIASRKGFVVMTGEVGTGKTAHFNSLRLQSPSRCARLSRVCACGLRNSARPSG
jgi:general secretion pathway protein A